MVFQTAHRYKINPFRTIVFPKLQLFGKMKLSVNIHPALPLVRGVGYDTIPLIENHHRHDATLHQIIEEIDLGEIFHVFERPLDYGVTSSQLRKDNQTLCLNQLELLKNWMLDCQSVKSLESRLTALGKENNYRWSDTYISRSKLTTRLHAFRQCNPDHAFFK